MGATERIAELMKVMHEREIGEMLDFAEFLLAKRDREKTAAWATLDKYAGRYDGAKWQRGELYEFDGEEPVCRSAMRRLINSRDS